MWTQRDRRAKTEAKCAASDHTATCDTYLKACRTSIEGFSAGDAREDITDKGCKTIIKQTVIQISTVKYLRGYHF
jgi:hypothetical protein